MIGSFGKIAFSVSDNYIFNPRDLSRNAGARYAAHGVIGAKPKQEYLGPALDSLKFTLQLNAYQGVNPAHAAFALKAMAENGEAEYFILGGAVIGCYVIISISEVYELVTNNGGVMQLKIDIDLQEYR
jgi:phage protein U